MPSPAGFIRLILLPSLLLNISYASPATPIAPDGLFWKVHSVARTARPPNPYCPPVQSPLSQVHTPHSFAKPVCGSCHANHSGQLILNVCSVSSMARPPYCPPLPSLAGFICLVLLLFLLLDFQCATLAMPSRQTLWTVLFLNVFCFAVNLLWDQSLISFLLGV